jgi:glutathione S-transferase
MTRMKLYYYPGACSLADHIALHEAGLAFDLVKVDLKTHKLEDGRSYAEINPKGSVPALQFDDGEVLTENVAILAYIADQKPASVPGGPIGRHRLLEMLAFIASEVHKAFHPLFVPQASEAEKKQAGSKVEKKL